MQANNKSQAYQSSQKLGASPRETEAEALLQAARMLDAAIGGNDPDAYRAALRLNWRLWTIIQADVSSAENPLPEEIRQNLLSLSVFIDRHTVGALSEPSGAKLRVLIDINRNIASGLMATPEDGAGGDNAEPVQSVASSASNSGTVA